MRGDEAGRRLIYLALPFTAFGLVWLLAPPVTRPLGEHAGTARALGGLLAALGIAAIAFGAYLMREGEERIV